MKKNTAGKMRIVKGEKLFMFLIVLAIITMPIVTVFSKAVLSKANIEVEKISSKIQKQEGINESLEMQKNELASLSNIQDIAEYYGLSYNNDNIIVIK